MMEKIGDWLLYNETRGWCICLCILFASFWVPLWLFPDLFLDPNTGVSNVIFLAVASIVAWFASLAEMHALRDDAEERRDNDG